MAEGSPNKRSVNYDTYKIVKNYFKLSSKAELRHDLIFPFIISLVLILLLYFCDLNIIKILKDLNEVIITVMSILAGFNTASIAIISSSNPLGFVERLEQQGRAEADKLLKSLTCYFSYSIILQLFILIISIIASIALKFIDFENISDNIYYILILCTLFVIWFTLVLNSLFITLRNVGILHNFILYLAKRR
ncbi:hypothetical protein [Priestia filamentosa]|uniref:hypothetical protein n=1 Tax=Priestia filamentosa TaxID=1402861 RepID=UPI0039820F11